MATALFMAGVQQVLDDNGDPLDSGNVYFYEPGTTTLKNTYTTSSLSVANTNPVILDANGRPDNATGAIWLNGEYKYKFTTSADVAVGATIDNLNPGASAASASVVTIPPNGSFEDDVDLDNTPDNWTLSALTDGTIALDETDQAHGYKSLKFTSGGSGGGTATSTRFDVLAGDTVGVTFTYKSSVVDSLNKVDLKTYDKDDGVVDTHSILSEGAANPTSYTTYSISQTVGATAVRAEVIITGIDAASTTKTAGTTTNIDNIAVESTTNKIVNGKSSYGLVVLDAAESLVNASAVVGSWTQYDMSAGGTEAAAAATAGAVKAILRTYVQAESSGSTGVTQLYIQKNGLGGSKTFTNQANHLYSGGTGNGLHSGQTEITVNLDSNSDFEYEIDTASTANLNVQILLVGYYV